MRDECLKDENFDRKLQLGIGPDQVFGDTLYVILDDVNMAYKLKLVLG